MDPASLALLTDMVTKLALVPIFAILVIGPAWIAVAMIKARNVRQLNTADQAALQAADQTLRRMEQRMATLEHILDAEAPAWRAQYHETGGRYGQQVG